MADLTTDIETVALMTLVMHGAPGGFTEYLLTAVQNDGRSSGLRQRSGVIRAQCKDVDPWTRDQRKLQGPPHGECYS